MHSKTSILLALASGCVLCSPVTSDAQSSAAFSPSTEGFSDPKIIYSAGGHATCASGTLAVQASTSSNVRLNIDSHLTVQQATQITLTLDNANRQSFLNATIGPKTQVEGTYNISARLCWPVNGTSASNQSRVQLLTHGIGFSQIYWDFPNPNANASASEASKYSYVDFAAQKGEITFTYDRLGVGNSSHPDPIQVVQAPLELEILRTLTQMLRSGMIGNTKFSTVVGIGHSFGSALTAAVSQKYTDNFDAILLTGFESTKPGGPSFTSALNLLPQNNTGYLLPSTSYGVQYSFFVYPDFETGILDEAFRTIQTTTLGEQSTMELIGGVATNYTKPVFVLDGDQDLIFCNGNCNVTNSKRQDFPAATLAQLFPAADKTKSGTYLLVGSGHGVNLAANAGLAYSRIQSFVAGI